MYPSIGCETDDFSPASTNQAIILFVWMEYDVCTFRKQSAKAFSLFVQKRLIRKNPEEDFRIPNLSFPVSGKGMWVALPV